jgi:hypothetical protein
MAGAAALVRQYFRTGKYLEVAGTAGAWMAQAGAGGGEGGGFTPSAALLRAVLTNGAQDMAQSGGRRGSQGNRLLPAPSMEVGYGRLNLARSLRLNAPASPSLIVVDGMSQSESVAAGSTELARIRHGHVQRHCLWAAAGSNIPLRITLAWTDPPGELNSAVALVHDLDLAVYHHGSDTLKYGNHQLRAAGADAGDDQDEERSVTDVLNPTEQVVMAAPQADSVYVVFVMGTKVVRTRPEGGGSESNTRGSDSSRARDPPEQDYALAITGMQLEALGSRDDRCRAVACPRACSGHGTCNGGVCECAGAYWGVDCALIKACPKGKGGETCSGTPYVHPPCTPHVHPFDFGAYTCFSKLCIRQPNVATATFTLTALL